MPSPIQGFTLGNFGPASASNPIATNTGQMFGPTAADLPGASIGLGTVMGVAQLGLAGYQLSQTLNAVSDGKAAVRAESARRREAAKEQTKFQNDIIGLTAFRLHKKQRAQNGPSGFSARSQSFLDVQNRVVTDSQTRQGETFKELDNIMQQIQAEESATLKKLSGIKSSGILKTAITAVGVVAAPFTGGASLVLAGAAQSAV